MHYLTIWEHSIKKRKRTSGKLNSSKGCICWKTQWQAAATSVCVCLFSCSVMLSYAAFHQVGESTKTKANLSGETPWFRSVNYKTYPANLSQTLLLVALISISDLFIKLGADISKTVIMPLLFFPCRKEKWLWSWRSNWPRPEDEWGSLLSSSVAAFALPLLATLFLIQARMLLAHCRLIFIQL